MDFKQLIFESHPPLGTRPRSVALSHSPSLASPGAAGPWGLCSCPAGSVHAAAAPGAAPCPEQLPTSADLVVLIKVSVFCTGACVGLSWAGICSCCGVFAAGRVLRGDICRICWYLACSARLCALASLFFFCLTVFYYLFHFCATPAPLPSPSSGLAGG